MTTSYYETMVNKQTDEAAGHGRSDAPGMLESVRALLNTWRIPHDTRLPADALTELARTPKRWTAAMPAIPYPAPNEIEPLRAVRDRLRSALSDPHQLDALLRDAALRVRFSPDRPLALWHEPATPTSSTAVLALLADTIATGTWARLRACPDCQWVFYDHSRNGSRVWCGMTAGGPPGRACGSIAKTRAYRERQRDRLSDVG
jgi:predicted RNA-binding Zn ribbon-like protein